MLRDSSSEVKSSGENFPEINPAAPVPEDSELAGGDDAAADDHDPKRYGISSSPPPKGNGELDRPVPLAVHAEYIPEELRRIPQWVVWRYVLDIDESTGEIPADYDKPPLDARRILAGSADPDTWATTKDVKHVLANTAKPHTWCPYETALAAYQRGGLDGLGIVLNAAKDEDGAVLIGVDLDHCRDPQTGEIADWARQIVEDLDTYTELSPSGEGLRLFLYGRLPPSGRKQGNIECYCYRRYVTVTGQHLACTPAAVEQREAQMLAVHRRVWPEQHTPKQTAPPRESTAVNLTDLELIERAKRAKGGNRFAALWEGDWSKYGSQSQADLALCNILAWWCGPNSHGRIDALVQQSGLYRGKWKRPDYSRRTITKALEGRTEYYSPKKSGRKPAVKHHSNGHAPPSMNGSAAKQPPAAENGSESGLPANEHLTDTGNAKHMVRRHGEGLLHCHPWKKWNVWRNGRWSRDATAETTRRAKSVAVELFEWAQKEIEELAILLKGTASES